MTIQVPYLKQSYWTAILCLDHINSLYMFLVISLQTGITEVRYVRLAHVEFACHVRESQGTSPTIEESFF